MNKQNNIKWIVYLRAIACLMIIMIHVLSGWIDVKGIQELGLARRILDINILQLLCRGGVTLFLMISGFLLLDPNKTFDYEKQKKYILKMIYVLLTFGLLFCFMEEFMTSKFNNIPKLIINSCVNLISEKSWGHMWYVYMLIGIYIITPMIKTFINNTDYKHQIIIISVLFILTTTIPTINCIFSFNITSFRLEFMNYICIYMLGYYVANEKTIIKNSHFYVAGIIAAILFILFAKKLYQAGLTQNNVFIIISSIAFFRFFYVSNISLNNIIGKALESISKYSFTIYLIHPVFINSFYKLLGFYPNKMPIFVGEITIFIITFLLSMVSSYIILKPPLFRKKLL